MAHKYNKGSEWRKWDLHIHTPMSINQNYGGDAAFDKFICALEALPDNVKVIGITDYYFIDGYEKVMKYKSNGRLKNLEKIFPILEFRVDTFGSGSENKLQKINLHILFDINEASLAEEIKKIREEFILQIPISCLDKHKTKMLSISNLVSEGSGSLQNGFSDLIPPTSKVFDLLNCDTWKDVTFTFLGYKEWSNLEKNNQLKPLKEDLYDKVNAFLSATQRDKFTKCQEWLNEYGDKRLLHSGDIHDFTFLDTAEKDCSGNLVLSSNYYCDTWIKADPTFEGLKQVLNEPTERVFIGEKPEIFNKVEQHKTKFIDKLEVRPIDGYSGQYGDWFDFGLDLNPGLVAIIGNKGSGKSAIADIIALCSNIDNQDDFSFLRADKFRGKGKPAASFDSKLTFVDGSFVEKNLGDLSMGDTNKLIKYLPQGYFETICNELSKAEQFQKEIENVVFQYIDMPDRLGKLDFGSLLDAKTSSINSETEFYKKDISILVDTLVKLEKKTNIKYKQSLIDKVAALNKEINALEIPDVIEDPNKDEAFAEANKTITESIGTLTQEVESIKSRLEQCRQDKANTNIEIQDLQNVKSAINQVILNFEQIKTDTDLLKYGIDWNELIKLEFNESIINLQINYRLQKVESIDVLLGNIESQSQKSLIKELSEKQKELENKQVELSGPQKLYQDYLLKLNAYNNRVKEIQGDATTSSLDNIYGVNQEINYVESELENEISNLFEQIITKVENIHRLKGDAISIYDQVKQKIDRKIEENEDVLDGISIEITASLTKSVDFESRILQFIDKGVKGSFYGTAESLQRLSNITEAVDFNTFNSVKKLISEIRDSLKEDRRTRNTEKRYIEEQVKDLKLFYEYLFSIDYLESNYNLKQDGKLLEYLSPGEKGALLLVFYLLLDMDNKPLILDQPEDNLDNASVANTLVKFIKRAKNRRQIIIVTHNPNLAVVSDADQIVYVNIDKKNKNKFSYESGSIENPNINKHIVDVLEGAMPAFRKRDDKYYDVK